MLVSIHNLTKYNQLKCIVDNVSMTIEDRDKIAIVGVNGTGKSTLLKIIAGIEDYQGEIIRKKGLTISYLPQDTSFIKDNTVIKEVYNYIDKNTPEYEIKAILNKFGIENYEQKINELSGGQLKRIALSIALLKPCDLLILDEPTNHLDSEMIEYLEKYLMKRNKALLMVTHDRYFLERVVNKIVEIDRSQLYSYEANYSAFLEQKARREEEMLNAQRKRHLFLKKELEWVRAGVQARTTKSKDRLQRFEQLSSIKNIETVNNVEMIKVSSRLGKKTIEMNDISMKYDKVLFEHFSYMFKRHDRIGILGVNGCGKSTLLNIIAGIIQPDSGSMTYGDTIKIGYFKQGVDDMDGRMRVIDYIKETNHYLITDEGQLSAKQMCEKFLFNTDMQYTPIARLSGGEKRRLYLLKILMSAPNVLLLDEPTNDLDIETLAILEDYLDYFEGIIITVSHDRYFLDRICDGLFVFRNGMIHYQNGGYSQYIDTKVKEVKKETPKVNTNIRMRAKKLSYMETKELAALEESLPLLEDEIKEIENKMDNADYKTIQELTNKRDELILKLDQDSERYMELLEKKEG
ncbi:MAG: ABC-F family ATP-binding cassette domain-containing protein [Bacilli bacterium]|nr:ABC-F family ATP-binding cassette domain-containing protein [Bacilli bacterium]